MSLRPLGTLPANVYWRRRMFVFAPVLALLILTFYVVFSPSGDTPAAAGSTATRPTPTRPSPAAPTTASTKLATTSAPTTSPVPTPAVTPCTASGLVVAAATSAPAYAVGAEPVLFLQVTNSGTTPCSTDLADARVELRVFNGDARVWSSHDCKVEPGTSVQTLAPQQPVRLSITWTGLSSQPGCTSTRMRVPAGVYTLYALLAGTQGAPAQFTLQ